MKWSKTKNMIALKSLTGPLLKIYGIQSDWDWAILQKKTGHKHQDPDVQSWHIPEDLQLELKPILVLATWGVNTYATSKCLS